MSYNLEMIGIYACAISADMIDLKTIRDRAYMHLVRYAVSKSIGHLTVTIPAEMTGKDPASSAYLFDFLM